MSTSCSGFCASITRQFDAVVAEGDLRRYHTKGPNPTTRQLRDGILRAGAGQSLLDVGAGVGALSFELLEAGFGTAVALDAAPAYVAAARREVAARGLDNRMTVEEADFVATGEAAPSADAVVMDRVVCCYPEFRPLLERALDRSQDLFAYSYPRDRWYVRIVVALQNAARAVAGKAFRTTLHPAAAMEDLILAHGFYRASRTGSLVWAVDVYRRRRLTLA